jgi:hypothetical protein
VATYLPTRTFQGSSCGPQVFVAPAMAALSLAGSREQFSMWLLQNVGIEGNDFTVNEARATASNGDALLCSLAGQVCTPAGRRRSSGGRGGHGEGQRALRSRGASMFGEVSGVSLFYTPTFFGRTEHLRCFPHVSGATYVPRGVGGNTCGQGRRGLYSPACTVRARTAQTTSGLPTY